MYDTCVAESAHKRYIKITAKYSRTFASHNKSELHILQYIQGQQSWSAVMNKKQDDVSSSPQEDIDEVTG